MRRSSYSKARASLSGISWTLAILTKLSMCASSSASCRQLERLKQLGWLIFEPAGLGVAPADHQHRSDRRDEHNIDRAALGDQPNPVELAGANLDPQLQRHNPDPRDRRCGAL